MLFENINKWWLSDNNRIEFSGLYLDREDKLVVDSFSRKRVENAVIQSSLPIKGKSLIVDLDRNVQYNKVE